MVVKLRQLCQIYIISSLHLDYKTGHEPDPILNVCVEFTFEGVDEFFSCISIYRYSYRYLYLISISICLILILSPTFIRMQNS